MEKKATLWINDDVCCRPFATYFPLIYIIFREASATGEKKPGGNYFDIEFLIVIKYISFFIIIKNLYTYKNHL